MTGPGMRAVVVVRDGRIVGERYGEGFSAETPLLGWSMTKTVTAAIIGTLVKDGKAALSDQGLFEAWKADGRGAISLADMMAMSSGLEFNEDYGDVTDVTRMLYLEPDMAAFAAAKPLAGEVGKTFSYSSGTTMMLSRFWQDRIGDAKAALDWPRARLFAPLGMTSAVLEIDARGHFRRLVLSLCDGARLGAVRAVPAAGRRLGRTGDPAGRICLMDARGGAGVERRLWARATVAAGARRRDAAGARSRRRVRSAGGCLLDAGP